MIAPYVEPGDAHLLDDACPRGAFQEADVHRHERGQIGVREQDETVGAAVGDESQGHPAAAVAIRALWERDQHTATGELQVEARPAGHGNNAAVPYDAAAGVIDGVDTGRQQVLTDEAVDAGREIALVQFQSDDTRGIAIADPHPLQQDQRPRRAPGGRDHDGPADEPAAEPTRDG